MVRYSEEQITKMILDSYKSRKINILAPVVRGRKGHYRDLFEQIRNQGFLKVRIDGEVRELSMVTQVNRYQTHDIEIVIDRLLVDNNKDRLGKSIELAFKKGKNMLMVLDEEKNELRYFSRLLMCPTSGIAYQDPEPNTFSFNSPYGACPKCNGLGKITAIDINKIIPDPNLSIKNGGIAPIGSYKNNMIFKQIVSICSKYDFDINTPLKDIPEKALDTILYGSNDYISLANDDVDTPFSYFTTFEGIINVIENKTLIMLLLILYDGQQVS